MILPTSLILKAYPTLIEGIATRDTCELLNTTGYDCGQCLAFSGISTVGFMCGFRKSTNPDYIQMFELFYNKYPEYAI